ncbi:hypothetical protein QCE63_16460 [Caballeronia sp. LZ065]|uniref:hypothetical protein n=1 Tax=Caballeronia sp. LZ065 TaxID=3038571 RepID=UPI00286019B7|nr:hypothetical protein [Caballeronia sp. LZ065]MDR5781016.1 hypothetical protein [Caballeronia sp. LZ065]
MARRKTEASVCEAFIWSGVRESIEQLLVLTIDCREPWPRAMIMSGIFLRCGCEFADRVPLRYSPLNEFRPYTLFHDSCHVVKIGFDVALASDLFIRFG